MASVRFMWQHRPVSLLPDTSVVNIRCVRAALLAVCGLSFVCQCSYQGSSTHRTQIQHVMCRYCECFASGRYCDGCNCVNCCNNMENESTRQSAVEAILERNPNAFRPKIQAGASVSHSCSVHVYSCFNTLFGLLIVFCILAQ